MVIYKRDDYKPFLFFSIFYILLYGFRPISGYYFGDTSNYAASYEMLQTYGTFNAAGLIDVGADWLFNIVMLLSAQVIDVNVFFVIVISFYIMLMYAGCRKLDLWHGATLMLFCIGAFSFYTYSVNGIRNGVACSIVILALAGVCKGERVWPIILAFLAIGCHKSTALPLLAMFFTYFVRNPKYMFSVWIAALLLSLLIGEQIEVLLTLISYDDRLAANLTLDDADGVELEHRFRWDFLLYSSMPIILGAYTLFVRKIYNNTYLILLGTYIYANAFWLLAIRAIFSNRIAYLSWFLYPIVLAYPLLNLPVFEKNHSQKAAWILLAHFSFTTIMWLLGK